MAVFGVSSVFLAYVFVVAGDGYHPYDADDDLLFAYGTAVPASEVGTTLPNLRLLAEVHGWTVTLETEDDELTIVVSGVSTSPERVEASADGHDAADGHGAADGYGGTDGRDAADESAQ